MKQKKTALSARLRNMDTWQEQWEEGCPGGLNTTPHLSPEVRAFRHFFFCLRRDPPPKPSTEEGIKMFFIALLTALNVKVGQSTKNWVFEDTRPRQTSVEMESFGEPFPLISQKFAIKSQSNHRTMCCPPLLSSIFSHPLHRLTGILQRGWISLSDFMTFSQTGVSTE